MASRFLWYHWGTMSNISWNEISDRAIEFASNWQDHTNISSERGEAQSFWSDFLSVFNIDRRRHGAFFEYAVKKGSGSQGFIDMFWPGKILAEQKAPGRDLAKASLQAYEYLETLPDHDLPEAIIVSDFVNFRFINLETNESVEFALVDFPKHVKLFGFLIGQTSKRLAEEDPVNRQAAENMAKLHNQLRDDNYTGHDLEVLLIRLVFCMFADDAGIFDHHALRDYLVHRTNPDGSDLGARLIQVFETLNTPEDSRQSSLDESLATLPYVNGGLFSESIKTPSFTSSMRQQLLKAMELDWSQVSPAIFGSMFQGVMDEKERRNLGAHYTSEKNILRVIKPLFLDDLYQELAKATQAGPRKKFDELRKLQDKLAQLKFLDPACGSGNFLVITYRELRKLEHKIVALLSKDQHTVDWLSSGGHGVGTLKVNVDQMYGIEVEEFPSLIAQTALWLTDHQMNMEYSRESGRTFKRLPLTKSARIVHANALTIDWEDVIAPEELDYILGNPPFIGQTYQSKEQKQEVAQVLSGIKKTGVLDFVSAWYGKATDIMKQNPRVQTALVSTNSITQGEQVSILWKYLLAQGIKINFAHRTFKWANDARGVAGVHCVIIGFALFDRPEKRLFEYADVKDEPNEIIAKNINPYLIDSPNVIVEKIAKPLQKDVIRMTRGSQPTDGGSLLLNENEAQNILAENPKIKPYIRRFSMGEEFIKNIDRYCLWLKNCPPDILKSSPSVLVRIQAVRDMRMASSKKSTQDWANRPTVFTEDRQPEQGSYLAIPRVSSERRSYIPIGFLNSEIIAGDKLQIIPNANLYHFGVLSSNIHNAWMRAVAGRLESRYSYSVGIVYNNFIWPKATDSQKTEIERLAQNVLDARAEFPDSSLADLYDPLTMPPSLAKAHKTLDRAVDRLYRKEPFPTDTERVALLFDLYQQKTDNKPIAS